MPVFWCIKKPITIRAVINATLMIIIGPNILFKLLITAGIKFILGWSWKLDWSNARYFITAVVCLKSIMETPEKCVKSVQS